MGAPEFVHFLSKFLTRLTCNECAATVKLENDQQHKNLRVYSTQSLEEVASFTQKAQTGWALQYTADETYACRLVNSELHAFKTSDWEAGIAFKLRLEGSTQFTLSPGRNPSAGFFIPEKKGAPGSVKVFNLTTLSSQPANPKPSSQKTFFKSDKVSMKWNAAGTMLLVVTQTEVDKTNKNYYGETNMYLMSAAGGFDCRVSLGAFLFHMLTLTFQLNVAAQTRRDPSTTLLGRLTKRNSLFAMAVCCLLSYT